jgi:hypothetical protein
VSFNRGTMSAPGTHRGQPLMKRTSDGAYVQVFYSPFPFRHNGVLVSPVASFITFDGQNYAAITDAQLEAGYTPSSQAHNLTGR